MQRNLGFQALERDRKFEFHLGTLLTGCEYARRTGFRNVLACRRSHGFAGFHPGLFGPSTLPAPHLAVRAWGTAPTTNDPEPSPAPGQAESSSGEVVYGSSQLHAASRFPNLPLCQLSTSLSNKDNGTRISEALGGEGEEEEEEETRVGCQGEWGHARGWRPWGMQRPSLPAL